MIVAIICEVLVLCLIVVAMMLVMNGEGSREQKLMEFFLYGSLVQNAGYILELTASTAEVAIASIKIEYVGSTFIPLCYCWFLHSYCYKTPPKRLLQGIGIANLIMLLFVFTCDRHPLFYRELNWVETGTSQGYLQLGYGPLFPLFLLCWVGIPFALALFVLINAILHQPKHRERRQYVAVLIMSSLPIIIFIAFALKLIKSFDPTPMTLGLCMSLVVILIWNRRNYDFRHLAASVVLSSMSDGVIALDEQQRLVSCNPAAMEIFPQLKQMHTGNQIADIENFSEDMLNEDVAHSLEFGGRCFESHAKQIKNEDGRHQGYVILLLDVTDTRNHIDEIMQVRMQAEQANLAKSEFLANMSHEIRTPMNAIIGLSDIILEESRGRKVYAYAQDVQSAAKNLLAIINDILDLSKVEAGKMELVLSDYNVKSLVGEIVSMMDMAASKRGLLMKYEYDTSIPCKYRGDAGRIKQILINLLNNAIKFTREGYVKISIAGHPGTSPDEELLTFRVEDTGCGIRKEDCEKIFEDFKQVNSQLNRSAEGTGLGLSITKHLVQLMNGQIEVESEYGKGTVFTVTIPQKIVDRRSLAEVPENEHRAAEQIDTFSAPGVSALIVDDNTVNRKVARGFLNTYGLELTDASSGPEAIALVKEKSFDLIFMDHMMPEMDGIEAVEHIRQECGENGQNAVIIALTANAMEGVKEKFLSCGFQDFITKPLDRKSLNELLKRWIPTERRRERPAELPFQRRDPQPDMFRIKGIDVSFAAQHSMNDAESYREILSLFCLDGKRKTVLLQDLIRQDDLKGYETEVHGLKSASANIGALELSALAKAQELAARSEDRSAIEQGFPTLLRAYKEQLSNIQAFLSGEPTVPEEDSLPEMDRETVVKEVGDALERLENFRSKECAEKIAGLLQHKLSKDLTAQLREIQNQLKLYEDDEAEKLLHQLLDELQK